MGRLLVAGAFRRRVDRAIPDRVSTRLDETPRQDRVPSTLWAWSLDVAGKFTASSSAGTGMIGYGPADLIGQNVALVLDAAQLRRA